MAHETGMHERRSEGGPVTITLAVPTPFAVDPARLVAWLAAHHWTVVHGDEHCKMWMRTAPSGMSGHICLFNDLSHPHWREGMASTVTIVARTEGLEPHDLAALIAPPVEGPALQWAMMSERARSEVIARIADLAATDRKSVAILRADGCADQALEAEGDALGLEAAAAVLRGGAHG